MDEKSDELSDGLDEFEASADEKQFSNKKKGDAQAYQNKPYDEAYEISQDLSMAESFDGRDAKYAGKKLQNDKYDEAVDVSQSFDHGAPGKGTIGMSPGAKGGDAKGSMTKSGSQSILNKPFDEALDISASGSDDSVDTRAEEGRDKKKTLKPASTEAETKASSPARDSGDTKGVDSSGGGRVPPAQKKPSPKKNSAQNDDDEDEDEDDDDDDDDDEAGEDSYANIEGAYNPKDYDALNVTAEVRDLFQYIDRFKPQEQELDTTLKCFIPDYIPAIGEMDAFIKIPRPDNKDDNLGLKFVDEPASNQSDPTVLELQLRAMSKKAQYGDVAVRSIENAEKNPAEIEKWIKSIEDLHRTKPPPQVNYRRNMPDMDALLDMWPPEFESALETLKLPSPDLDLSLLEYTKVLCTILDIPVYENPIESLHVMFTLFMDFRNNPHFQARLAEQNGGGAKEIDKEAGYKVGGADVMEIIQGK